MVKAILPAEMTPSERFAELAELQIPAFGCTPDRFGELMSHALSGADVATWAAAEQAAASA